MIRLFDDDLMNRLLSRDNLPTADCSVDKRLTSRSA